MKNKQTYKQSLLSLLLIFGLTVVSSANAQRSIDGNVRTILSEISALADEFNLTNKQKAEMRTVMMDYLPSLALKSSAMLQNRQALIESTLGNDSLDEDYLQEMANKQGALLSSIIVIKEHLKKDIRLVLTEDQKEFVDELIITVIQHRLNG